MYRLFVALSVPSEICSLLAHMQHGLEGARWRPTENFHITLSFIGETDRHGYDTACLALKDIDAPAFDVHLAGVDFFGDKRPRAVWAGAKSVAQGNDVLGYLQSKVEVALRRSGFELASRKFIPHVTLAYLSHARRTDVAQYCAINGLFQTPVFHVDQFHLYAAHLGSEATHYAIEQSYVLCSSSPSSSSR